MKKFIILIPIYNDCESLTKLLQEVNTEIAEWDSKVSIIIVNDSSTKKRLEIESNFKM